MPQISCLLKKHNNMPDQSYSNCQKYLGIPMQTLILLSVVTESKAWTQFYQQQNWSGFVCVKVELSSKWQFAGFH